MKKLATAKKPISAEAIARMADQGKGISQFFTGTGKMIRPVQQVHVDFDQMSDDEFKRHILGVLEHELGVYGFARFLRVYRAGSGDYTEERHQWLDGLSVEDALR